MKRPMKLGRKRIFGFTLVELMVVVTIALIVTVLGVVSMSSRVGVANLEEAAQSLASDVSYARTAALFKGCPTQIIICADAKCQGLAKSKIGDGYIGEAGENARYYAILRKTQYVDSDDDCYSPNVDPDDGRAGIVYNRMDFDRRPQALPSGVAFTAIYASVAGEAMGASLSANFIDWDDESSDEARNSLWFPTSISDSDANIQLANIPVNDSVWRQNTSGDPIYILFQLQLDNCDASDADDDCAAYFITMDESGEAGIQRCDPGSRTSHGNTCF